MLPEEILEERRRRPIAYVPLCVFEWHGLHLAIGMDGLKVERLCELAAEISGGFVFPALWYGYPCTRLIETDHDHDGAVKTHMSYSADKFTPMYYGTTKEEQIAFYQKIVYHTLMQLDSFEMRVIALLCGHHPLAEWVSAPVVAFRETHRTVRIFSAIENTFSEGDDDIGLDHGAKWETSYMMELRPDCVKMEVYDGLNVERLSGVGGEDPRIAASREVGKVACSKMAKRYAQKAVELLHETT